MAGKKEPARLAGGTSIAATQTKADIEAYLYSRGAEQVVVVRDDDFNRILIVFRLFGRMIRMERELATEATPMITRATALNQSSVVRPPTKAQIAQRLEAENRRRWRIMFLRVKMRLDLVFDEVDEDERQIAFYTDFLVDVVIPEADGGMGGTVGDFMRPQIGEAYEKRRPPRLLPVPGRYLLEEP